MGILGMQMKIGDRRFWQESRFYHKKPAQDYAQKRRERGYLARVIPTGSKTGYKYEVWVARKMKI